MYLRVTPATGLDRTPVLVNTDAVAMVKDAGPGQVELLFSTDRFLVVKGTVRKYDQILGGQIKDFPVSYEDDLY